MTVAEIVLPRRARPQPPQRLNPGGDCASCAIGGVLGLTVAETHKLIETTPNVGRSRPGWPVLMRELERCGLVEEYVADIPMWPGSWIPALPHGLTAPHMAQEWFRYVRMALRGGYYGLASINYAGTPYGDTDHLVVLCGAREQWVAHPTVEGCRSQEIEVLVSCSASCPEGRWRDVRDLLRCGGFDAIFVRPAGRDR